MTYRELLELYKQGKLEEKQQKEVEADIEKQDAISEYLYAEAELTGFDAMSDMRDPENGDGTKTDQEESAGVSDRAAAESGRAEEAEMERKFIRMVNRSIRKAFIRMGMTVGAVVLMIVLFVQFLLPGVVSAFYYNPNKEIGRDAEGNMTTNQMSLDMAVYTELFVPGYRRGSVTAQSRGYGNYEILIHQNSSYNSKFTTVSGKIERNKLTLYDTNTLRLPTGNCFEWSGGGMDLSKSLSEQRKPGETKIDEDGNEYYEDSFYCFVGTPDQASELLERLADNKLYVAYITLDKIMDYKDFVKYIDKREDLMTEVWCAAVTGESALSWKNAGFCYNLGYSWPMQWDNETYPALQLSLGSDESVSDEKMKDESFAKAHFTSLLRYLNDQKTFREMMDLTSRDLEGAAEYVEEHGLKIYGFATIAEKEDLLKLNKDKEVYVIGTEELK